jgi:protease stability complex PrcB-like protein
MKLFRNLILATMLLVPAAVGCAAEESEPAGVAADEAKQSVPFEVLEGVRKDGAEAGLTVLKSHDQYVDFFGAEPPGGVELDKHWVVHVSLGVRNTGGYEVAVQKIEKSGWVKKTLIVYALESTPGEGCAVTQALTNPQVAVRVNKQSSTPKAKLVSSNEARDCSAGGACEDLGGSCLSSPFDVTFPASCEDDYAMLPQPEGTCAAINQACCVRQQCGGFAGIACSDGAVCVDDPADDCDPGLGGADCGGVCIKKVFCGGFGGLPCPEDMTCVDDPDDDCDPKSGGADCGGFCVPA